MLFVSPSSVGPARPAPARLPDHPANIANLVLVVPKDLAMCYASRESNVVGCRGGPERLSSEPGSLVVQ